MTSFKFWKQSKSLKLKKKTRKSTSGRNRSSDANSSRRPGRHPGDVLSRFVAPSSRLKLIFSSKALRIFIISALFMTVLFFGYNFISTQAEELKSVNFSRVHQEELKIHDRQVDYTGEDVFNLLVLVQGDNEKKPILEGFVIIRLDPVSVRADIIGVHPDIYIPLSSSVRGVTSELDLEMSRIRDLMVIGELQNPQIPLAYVMYQLEELMAVSIDGYIIFPASIHDSFSALSTGSDPWDEVEDTMGFKSWTETWNSYWGNYFQSISVLKVWVNRDVLPEIGSNMTVADVYRFIEDFRAIPENEVQILTMEDDAISDVIDERGEEVKFITIVVVDGFLGDIAADERMTREQARIEVFNGTNLDGLGYRFSRWVGHLGGDVIRVKNAPVKRQKTVVYVTDVEKYAYTLSRVGSLWEDVEIVEGRPDFITTGDIIIVLGMDF